MIHTDAIVQRLTQLQEFYGLSAAAFADKIQVQRSSISHLLTGRNKPSLEFILKIIAAFPEVTLDWLLLGKGNFPNETPSRSLPLGSESAPEEVNDFRSVTNQRQLSRIILLYSDGSFENFDQNR
ncbi:helix-turn-helix transcriptional regulator [Arenibacter sp. GZD96]|uniref:helix-turn-helix transcriptional regulator n=1 Tax=Aurantibrevibacter litoralis TaxID=3106030 RepID=UPI002AFE11FA|nr:helix-turn-helix transcriptional regulator [Arenibacter sp. GZD-96]MEA1785374.1 helix-turn-helix transcriptional regulator [Arenibacter sp. GZD-96]